MQTKKTKFQVLKLNKETVTQMSDSQMAGISGGFLSIGAQCSCNNSCGRDNIPNICCAGKK